MRTWIAKHAAVSFYVLTLTLSWAYWLTLLTRGQRVEPGSPVTHFPGLLGPLVAAVAVTGMIGGRVALRELFGRMFHVGPEEVLCVMRRTDRSDPSKASCSRSAIG